MMPQFRQLAVPVWDAEAVAMGSSLFAVGMVKKLAIADNVAPFADAAFTLAAADAVSLVDGWLGAFAYAFQIYFDFSGYSDMAVGLSLLFGIRLPLNFASPYKATSIIEFWTRWHMSLSRFLRDYLYIPLGGNRVGAVRRYANLMAVMLLGGLWHGAGWTFIIWGGLHGLYLCANHLIQRVSWHPMLRRSAILRASSKRMFVFLAVTIAWVFFRAESVSSAVAMLCGMGGLHGLGTIRGHSIESAWLTLCLVVVWYLPNSWQLFAQYRPTLLPRREIAGPPSPWPRWHLSRLWAVITAIALAGSAFAVNYVSPFLYFRF
jgi:alginate O-acetyltransferase complex protein AlgI